MEIEDGCHNSQHRTLGKVSETTKLFEANQLSLCDACFKIYI